MKITFRTLLVLVSYLVLPMALLGQNTCGGSDDDFDDYVFNDSPPESYVRVDRMGMPAIATAVISSKDAYNAANPTDDAAGIFVEEIVGHVEDYHLALDDDLTSIGLTPCAVDTCVGNAAPLIIPDTLKLDPTQESSFPNGRALTNQVIDITLAVVLLDLGNPTGCFGGPCTASTLAEVPLNPPSNDAEFSTVFPYLSPPWSP